MYVNGHSMYFSNSAARSFSPGTTFKDARVAHSVSTGGQPIELIRCETIGAMSTGSGGVKVDGGTLVGQISSGSGDVSVRRGAAITGGISTGSGDVRIADHSTVSIAGQTDVLVKSGSGNINLTDAVIAGHITTCSGNISMANATVDGDVHMASNRFSIEESTVAGTLTAVGDSLCIGDHSRIGKIELKVPPESGSALDVGGSTTIIRRNGITIINGGSFFSGPGITVVGGHLIGGRLAEANTDSNDRRVPGIEQQTIHLGAGTRVENIAFEAARCKLVLAPGAQYSGPQPDGMTVEHQENFPPPDTAGRNNVRIAGQMTNRTGTTSQNVSTAASSATAAGVAHRPSTAVPTETGTTTSRMINDLVNELISLTRQERHPPRSSARENRTRIADRTPTPMATAPTAPTAPTATAPQHLAPVSSSCAAPGFSLPDKKDFSTRAEGIRILAMDAVFNSSIRNADECHTRQVKMGDIGDQYLEGLKGPQGKNVYMLIAKMMTPEDRAKVLTSICYSTLINADLDRSDPVCDKLKNLCKKSVDIAGVIKGHIKKVDGAGIQGGLFSPVSGRFSMLNQPDGRLPYATQLMLDTLGLR